MIARSQRRSFLLNDLDEFVVGQELGFGRGYIGGADI